MVLEFLIVDFDVVHMRAQGDARAGGAMEIFGCCGYGIAGFVIRWVG
jgi:hypothetical protein